MKRLIFLFITVCVIYMPLIAYSSGFIVNDIRVEGLNRISAGTVFNYLPVKVGDELTAKKTQLAIRELYKTGFFQDIHLKQEGDVLVVSVVERPSISDISIKGAKDISEKDLKKGFKEIGLSEGRIFNRSLLDQLSQELKRQYFSRGRYSVEMDTTVTPLERNRVAIDINIREGRVAKIKEINIVGNKTYPDKQLLKKMSLKKTGGFFKFFSRSDQYSKEKLVTDTEKIRNFYQNNGFLKFTIESTQVSISPDKEDIYITVNLSEGRKYTIKDYNIAGKFVIPEEEIRKNISIKPGDYFSRKEVTDSAKRISDALGNQGYAFANVNPIPETDDEKGTVSFTFFIDPGKKVYIRRINFSGNTVTRDEVLRREMRQMEGAWFSPEKIKRSRVRLQRLGFFESVNVETPQVPGTSDQVDVNIHVKERPTGNLLFSIGYSDVDGAIISGSVTESNLFGTGKQLSASFDNSQATESLRLRYLNPYYTQSGISRGFDLVSTKVDAAEADTAAYLRSTSEAGVSFGFPTSEEQSLRTRLAYDLTEITVAAPRPPDPLIPGDLGSPGGARIAQDFVATYGNKNAIVKATLGWAWDTLNDAIFPSDGSFHRVSIDTAIPGSELEYYRVTYDAGRYFPISPSVTFRTKLELGYGDGYGDTAELPFYKNFFAGGSNTVRGYQSRSLGPRDRPAPGFPTAPQDPIGGNRRILGNLELFFPFPGQGEDNKAMRLSLFMDGGMVYGPDEEVDLGTVRYSAGLSFNWFSPIGPLALSFATPLNAEPGDEIERVQFSLGVPLR